MATRITLTPEQEEDIRSQMRDGELERAFWNAHRTEFTAKYPKQVVAVVDGQVVATAGDVLKLIEMLNQLGLAPNECWVEYFDPEPRRWTL